MDLGKKGPSQGDRMSYRSRLLDQDGRQVGTSPGECFSAVPTAKTLGLTECSLTYLLKGGQLAVLGPSDFAATSGELAVVGGTGRYLGTVGVAAYRTTASPRRPEIRAGTPGAREDRTGPTIPNFARAPAPPQGPEQVRCS